MTDTQRLAAIKARLAARTPGEWHAGLHFNHADSTLIANAPADLEFLIAEVERLQSELRLHEEAYKLLENDYAKYRALMPIPAGVAKTLVRRYTYGGEP